jgi:hypothetical protein
MQDAATTHRDAVSFAFVFTFAGADGSLDTPNHRSGRRRRPQLAFKNRTREVLGTLVSDR